MDGRPTAVLAADYLIQAVAVTPGHHVIEMAYDDPTIGYGLLGSMLAVAALLLAAFLERRRHTPGSDMSSGLLDLPTDSGESTS